MSALICGSMAYDNIMLFDGHFKDHILPDKVHMLNVAFLVPELRRNFGGCAGNIAYNLKLLGGDGHAMGTVGQDFKPYAEWLKQHGIDDRYLKVIDDAYTAQAYITTDKDDNQITAFHPGAMNCSHENVVPTDAGVSLGIIAPDGRDGMVQHALQFAEAGIPFVFDPGQGLPMFDGDDLLTFIDQATYVAVNDYESQMLADRTGLSPADIAKRVDALIVTRGGEGSIIYTEGKRLDIAAVRPSELKDPTGCGDAYRAGLLFGLMNDFDWTTVGNIASLMGSLKIAHNGTQNHAFSADEFASRFKDAFGYAF
ncbi:MAG: carbohydrate kinase family protein [Gammaproteobacteria bacterium]|nr:carbohydrate kinase family protein [Gammaproteobacteria bacterium]